MTVYRSGAQCLHFKRIRSLLSLCIPHLRSWPFSSARCFSKVLAQSPSPTIIISMINCLLLLILNLLVIGGSFRRVHWADFCRYFSETNGVYEVCSFWSDERPRLVATFVMCLWRAFQPFVSNHFFVSEMCLTLTTRFVTSWRVWFLACWSSVCSANTTLCDRDCFNSRKIQTTTTTARHLLTHNLGIGVCDTWRRLIKSNRDVTSGYSE